MNIWWITLPKADEKLSVLISFLYDLILAYTDINLFDNKIKKTASGILYVIESAKHIKFYKTYPCLSLNTVS